jgi:hypothetical protein
MSDNKKIAGKQDRERISLSEDYEVKDWSKKLGVSSGELTQAVKEVGNKTKDVEAFLRTKNKK